MTSNNKKILVINIFGIGDVLFTTPLVRNLRKKFPDAYIAYLCNRRAKDILEHNPHINKLFIYERDEFYAVYQKSKIGFLKKIRTALPEIKKEGFDVVIDLSLNTGVSFFMLLAGIPKRIGFNYKNRSPFLTEKIPLKGFSSKHVVEYYLEILAKLDVEILDRHLELFPSAEDQEWAGRMLQKEGVQPEDLLIAVVPGGGSSWGADAGYKRWPAACYAKLVDKVIEKFPAKIILMGDPTEKVLGQQMARVSQKKFIDLIGKTNLGQYSALLSRCTLAVVNDGGPLHMSVAAGIKTVSLFGPVDENIYGPFPRDGHYVVTADIACRPCYRKFRRASCQHVGCLNRLSVEQVFSVLDRALKS